MPDSPVTSTRPLVGATLAISSRTFFMAGLSPSISSEKRRSRERTWTFSSRLLRERAFRTETSTRSRSTGFPKKSLAPRLMASTTSLVSAWPEMTMTGRSRQSSRALESRVRPSMPGRRMSKIPRSTGSASSSLSAASAVSASWTSYPSSSRTIRRVRRMFFSSSTTSRVGLRVSMGGV